MSAYHDLSNGNQAERFDEAVQVILNSSLMFPHIDAFWDYVYNDQMSMEELIDEIR